MLDEGNEHIEQTVAVQAEHTAAQAVVPAQGLDARLGLVDERFDDRRRDVVAVQRRFERARVTASARVKPIALQHTVVERSIRVHRVRVALVKGTVRGGPVRLGPVRLEHCSVLPVRELHRIARRQLDRRKLHVGRRQRRVGIVRDAVEAAGERHQPLAFRIEDVLLLVVEALDREAVDGQRLVGVHPAADRLHGNREQLGIEPGGRLLVSRKQVLHLLASRVDRVVALILIVVERREVPDAVHQGTDLVLRLKCRQQLL